MYDSKCMMYDILKLKFVQKLKDVHIERTHIIDHTSYITHFQPYINSNLPLMNWRMPLTFRAVL
jgi:hypothetical protein